MNEIFTILSKDIVLKIFSCKKVLLAYSGGIDSTVLLDILFTLREKKIEILSFLNEKRDTFLEVRAVYINHNIQKDSGYWLYHCKKECENRNIEFHFANAVINSKDEGIESEARKVRYKNLVSFLKPDEVLITAHNKEDQVETFFLALKRGSGPTGLSAMQQDSIMYKNFRILRPFLFCSRISIRNYAIYKNLSWIEDPSNKNLCFDRNFLRHEVLPLFYKRWRKFTDSVIRSANICDQQERLLDDLLQETMIRLINSDGSINLKPLRIMKSEKRLAVLRRWLQINNEKIKFPSYTQIQCIWKYVVTSKKDSQGEFRIGEWIIKRFKNKLYVLNFFPYVLSKYSLHWSKSISHLFLPYQLGYLVKNEIKFSKFSILKYYRGCKKKLKSNFFLYLYRKMNFKEKILNDIPLKEKYCFDIRKTYDYYILVRKPELTEKIFIRFGPFYQKIYVHGNKHGRKLKDIWKELRIPPWERNKIPLLFYNDLLISALGIFITHEALVKQEEENNALEIIWKS